MTKNWEPLSKKPAPHTYNESDVRQLRTRSTTKLQLEPLKKISNIASLLPKNNQSMVPDQRVSENLSPTFPFHMVWIATNLCNTKCIHCSSASGRKNHDELNTVEAISLLDSFARSGILDVAISGGEPLLREDIFEVIEYAASLGIRIGLGSNGTTITPQVVSRLKSIGIHRLQISLDGLESTHDTVRCFPGLYKKAVNAIKIGIEGGLRVHVCFTLYKMNKDEISEILKQSIMLGVKRFNISRFVPTGRGNKSMDMTRSEWEAAVAYCDSLRWNYSDRIEITTHLAQMILSEPALMENDYFAGCQAGRGQGCVGSTGEVSPCVVLPVVIGNIREKPFDEIWQQSPIIESLQNRKDLKGQCMKCSYIEKCGGCRAVAFAYTGDYLETDPRCWI